MSSCEHIVYHFVPLSEIDNIINSSSSNTGIFLELLEENDCVLTGDRPLVLRITELFNKSTKQKDVIISPKLTDEDKCYKVKRSISTHTYKQQEIDRKNNIEKIINAKYITYLSTFILFNRDIPYIYTKDIIKLEENCSALKQCTTDMEIAQIINDRIFNVSVWEYIIKNKLNKNNINDINECIMSLIEQLKTPNLKETWLISRIDKNGKERFLKDILKFNTELSEIFKLIKIPY